MSYRREGDRDRSPRGKERERERDRSRSRDYKREDRDRRDNNDKYRGSDDKYNNNRESNRDNNRARNRESNIESNNKYNKDTNENKSQSNNNILSNSNKTNMDIELKSSISSISMLAKSKISILSTASTTDFKPVYLTKQQRQEISMKKMEEERQVLLNKQNLERSERENDIKKSNLNDKWSNTRYFSEEEKKIQREKQNELESLEKLKSSYIAPVKSQRKVIPASQKMKLVFEWNADEDTSNDLNPLYAERANVSLGFGRGFIAGVDKKEQLKNSYYKDSSNQDFPSAPIDDEYAEKARLRADREAAKQEAKLNFNRHWSEKKLSDFTERDWRILKEDYNIYVRGTTCYPLVYWSCLESLRVPESICRAIREAKFKEPSAIQRAAIPIILQGKDVVGIAETGSGKTLAFLVPLLIYCLSMPILNQDTALNGPYSLVLAPTRELAIQIEENCKTFAKYTKIRSLSVVGGLNIEDQAMSLRNGMEVLVGTPGRICDLIRSRYLVLNQCNYIVLDEADRMIDMGFGPQVNEVMGFMQSSNTQPVLIDPSNSENIRFRQTIMFSATMPESIEKLTKDYMRNPSYVSIGQYSGLKAAENVVQRVDFVKEYEKERKLFDILSEEEFPVIIFCNAKRSCDFLASKISDAGYRCSVMHGDKNQEQRNEALKGFKAEKYDILIGTDVLGRGIDIQGVKHVINYEMPDEIEKYCHRIGRTARAGTSGIATSFITTTDTDIMFDLKEFLTRNNQVVPEELARHESAQAKGGADKKAVKYVTS